MLRSPLYDREAELILNTNALRTTLRAHLSSKIICLFQPRSTLSKQCLTFVGLGIASNNDLIEKNWINMLDRLTKRAFTEQIPGPYCKLLAIFSPKRNLRAIR